ncbi:MAG: Spy/CpxP family protein refolding chaperone [Bacteroidota bacterium]
MITRNKYRILTWLVVILLATNISMGVSFIYHKQQDKKLLEQVNTEETEIEIPAQQRTRFFREQLDLQPAQVEVFRELNRDFNRSAWQITNQLAGLRIQMIEELGKEIPDSLKLNAITEEIGILHTELKKETIRYYREMEEECNPGQRQKLNEIFMSMLRQEEDVKLPQRGRRNRFGNR